MSNDGEKPAANGPTISGDISPAALETILGSRVARNVLRRARRMSSPLIPNYELLIEGDVILCRQLNINGDPKPSPIPAAQHRHNFSDEESFWTHVMLYVGDMHVVEAHGWKRSIDEPLGVRVMPLTAYSNDHQLLVLRYKHSGFDSEFRQRIVRRALLTANISRRRYDWITTLNIWLDQRRWRSPSDERINCSEFVLECFAVGGQFMVEEYDRTRTGKDFFFPASFYRSDKFDQFIPDYMKLVRS